MVTLLSTAFQSENTTLEELFDCLIILYKFEPDLLIEKAAAEECLLSKNTVRVWNHRKSSERN